MGDVAWGPFPAWGLPFVEEAGLWNPPPESLKNGGSPLSSREWDKLTVTQCGTLTEKGEARRHRNENHRWNIQRALWTDILEHFQKESEVKNCQRVLMYFTQSCIKNSKKLLITKKPTIYLLPRKCSELHYPWQFLSLCEKMPCPRKRKVRKECFV